jgi:hypothetical protein
MDEVEERDVTLLLEAVFDIRAMVADIHDVVVEDNGDAEEEEDG